LGKPQLNTKFIYYFHDINNKKLYNTGVYIIYIIKFPGGLNIGDYIIKTVK